MDLLEMIQNYQHKATPSERIVIDYILSDPHNIVGYTSNELSDMLSVSNSTITRLSQKLGFKGYIEFSKTLFESFKHSATIDAPVQVQQLNTVMQELECIDSKLFNVLNSDIINLTETFKTFNPKNLESISKVLAESEKIYIVGFNSCKIIATFIHFHLDRIGFNVELITGGGSELAQQLGRPNQKQSIMLISFPKYSKDSKTVTKLSRALDIPLIVMTDEDNLLTEHADHKFL